MKLQGPQLIIIIAAVLAAAGGFWLGQQTLPGRADDRLADVSATVLAEPRPVPAFSLLDHHGRSIDESVFAGEWQLVFFGFTHCPDICPMTLQQLAQVRGTLASQGADAPGVVFVSVDPERDDPETVAGYIDYYDPSFLGITGDREGIDRLTQEMGIAVLRSQRDEHGEYDVDHTSAVFLVDPQGRLAAVFGMPHDPATIARDFTRIAGQRG